MRFLQALDAHTHMKHTHKVCTHAYFNCMLKLIFDSKESIANC